MRKRLPHYKATHTWIDGLRYHETPFGQCIGVTSCLSETANKEGLKRWVEDVGEEEAERIRKSSAGRGTKLHGAIEEYFKNKRLVPKLTSDIQPFFSSLLPYLPNIKNPILMEGALWHPSLFAGTVDMVASYRGEIALWDGEVIKIDDPEIIIDWKTARKAKKHAEYIKDYYLQCAAYAGAFNRLYMDEYKVCAKKALIFVALEDRPAQVFYLDEKELGKCWKGFNERLRDFFARKENGKLNSQVAS